jgi:hypothetical protein
MWVWRAYTMLAVMAAVLIAASATLRETIHEPWAQILANILRVATIISGGLGASAIQKRRRLIPPTGT